MLFVYQELAKLYTCRSAKLPEQRTMTDTDNPMHFFQQIINADIDETLNDNSQGYNNYAAPGADRLKITLSLFKF